jgi:hypothetical protein
MHTEFQLENVSGRYHLEDMGQVRITKMHLKQGDSCGSGPGPLADSCQYSNEPSGSTIKAKEFL